MVYIGVDACKVGWFAVMHQEENSWDFGVFPDIFSLWNIYQHARLILIDIPIGLLEGGVQERLCDKEARTKLGWPRCSSVFRVPCRAALEASNYSDAKRINIDKTSNSLSRQSWGIMPKIRELDRFLNDNITARTKIRETHPEICLWALNGRRPMEFNKKKEEGFRERIRVLCRVHAQADEIVRYALQEYEGKVGYDDAIDALAAAVTALLGRGRLLTIPDNPESDSKGLPMEMVYYPVP